MGADKGGRFEDGLEKAYDHDLPGMVDEAGAEREEAPCHDTAGEEEARLEFLQRDVTWDLTKDVAAVKDCLCQ